MPAGGREAPRVRTYSLTQRWSPALAGREGQVFRPHLVAVVNEIEGTCGGVEVVENPMRPAALARWLAERIGKTEAAHLWVDDANLVGPMTMYFPKLTVSWCATPPQLSIFLAGLARELPNDRAPEQNLAQSCGEHRALIFYGAARDFFATRPGERFTRDDRLCFRDSQKREWDVIALGSEEAESGFYVFDQAGGPPVCGVTLHQPAFLAAVDLDLIDRSGLVYPGGEYPWILRPSPQVGPSSEWVSELTWLLNALGDLQGSPIESDGRRLEPARKPGEVLADALLVYWRRKTQVARELAAFLVEFLQNWMLLKPRGQRNYERTFQELHWIGEDYLASVKKRKFWPDYFLGEPKFTGAALSEKDRQAYLKTWKQVSAFVEARSQ